MQEQPNNTNTDDDMNQMLLAIPANIQTGDMTDIEKTLSWAVWGWLVEQFVDQKIAERSTPNG